MADERSPDRRGPGQLELGGMEVERPRRQRGWLRSPLVKWSGSKMPIVSLLAERAPARFERYHEPFVGGGALFFTLKPPRSFLGDANAELVNLYQVVRDLPEALLERLAGHENTREHYLAVRGLAPASLTPVERGARTLYLNRTCFNGLYRVNSKGLFNVPYGNQTHTTFFQPEIVRRAHEALQGAEIACEDFSASGMRAAAGDFVYLDPPYAATLNQGRSYHYQAGGFTESDQRRVAELFRLLDRRGCLVMASNADCALTRELYAGFRIEEFCVRRKIGGKGDRRGEAAEIMVRNYSSS